MRFNWLLLNNKCISPLFIDPLIIRRILREINAGEVNDFYVIFHPVVILAAFSARQIR